MVRHSVHVAIVWLSWQHRVSISGTCRTGVSFDIIRAFLRVSMLSMLALEVSVRVFWPVAAKVCHNVHVISD